MADDSTLIFSWKWLEWDRETIIAHDGLGAGLDLGAAGPAADLPTRMPVKAAPAPARVFSWTGCYLGGHVGWGWGRKTITDTPQGDLTTLVGLPYHRLTSIRTDSSAAVRSAATINSRQNWVIGVEGQFLMGRHFTASAALPEYFPADTQHLPRQNRLDGKCHRSGWAIRGIPLARLRQRRRGLGPRQIQRCEPTYVGSWAASETRSGWTVGGGLEWAFADNWSAKLEYQYYDFGTRDVAFVGGAGAALSFLNPSIETVKQQIQTVTVGVNYRFSGLFH